MNMYLRLLLLRLRRRRGGRLGIWDTARTSLRVGVADLDLLGHVNNGKYLTMMDLGRMDLMFRSGFWPKLRREGWYPVVAGQTISYRRSLKLGQRFDLRTRIIGMDERWFYVEQTFVIGETVYAHAIVRGRFLREEGGGVDVAEVAALAGGIPEDRRTPEWVERWTEASRPPRTYPQE
ncbi:thioesterase family protein [Gulosibacter sp. 10]|uniref:acyl-CoA thioesterase n=1 Tax=Gulosibacter sp. 10 TaxID=1255570 RepID=UPI00097E8541|nr:acyl-CoA thioesterase [Gulosibacter sp. 10]SJM66172.1 Mesenchymal stem cell protein DSCD75 [Gulosibacter sp. 10]